MDATHKSGHTKQQLLAIAKGLRVCDPASLEAAIDFFISESRGNWHNRARAKFARRLKHCQLQPQQAAAVVAAVLVRLRSGQFSEQFTDQLRLALRLDSAAVVEAARSAITGPSEHVRRYGGWVLAHHSADAP